MKIHCRIVLFLLLTSMLAACSLGGGIPGSQIGSNSGSTPDSQTGGNPGSTPTGETGSSGQDTLVTGDVEDYVFIYSNQGGMATDASGVSLSVPAGAVPLNADGTPGGFQLWFGEMPDYGVDLPEPFEPVGKLYSFGEVNFVFEIPVTISLPIPEGTDPASIAGAAYMDATTMTWWVVPGNVDATSRSVTISTTHLSAWTLAAFKTNGGSAGGTVEVARPVPQTDYAGPDALYRGSANNWHGLCILTATYDDPTAVNWWMPPLDNTIEAENYWGAYGTRDMGEPASYWLPSGTYEFIEYVGQSEFNPGDTTYVPKHYTQWRNLGSVTITPGQTLSYPFPAPGYATDGWTVGRPPCWGEPPEIVTVSDIRYVTFEISLDQATTAIYPTILDACQMNVIGCTETADTNPCYTAGGGGGGGEGGGDALCPRMPDYCYSCMPDYPARFAWDLVNPDDPHPITPNTHAFELDVALDLTVLDMRWAYGFDPYYPELVELTSTPGTFHAVWHLYTPNNDNPASYNPFYVVVDGSGISFTVSDPDGRGIVSFFQVSDIAGSGTWSIGHPLFGTTGTGDWQIPDPVVYEVVP